MCSRNILDLVLHVLVFKICVYLDSGGLKFFINLFCIVIEIRCNRNNSNLFKTEPCREYTCIVFNEDAHEAFQRTENCTVEHYRMMLLVVGTDVLCVQSFCRRKLVVKLDCTALPLTAEGINQSEFKFWTVEGTFARLDFVIHSACLTCGCKFCFCLLPCFDCTNVVFRHCRKFNEKVLVESKVLVNIKQKLAELCYFAFNLFFCTDDMCIILNETTHAHDTVECTAWFVSYTVTEFSDAHWKVFV